MGQQPVLCYGPEGLSRCTRVISQNATRPAGYTVPDDHHHPIDSRRIHAGEDLVEHQHLDLADDKRLKEQSLGFASAELRNELIAATQCSLYVARSLRHGAAAPDDQVVHGQFKALPRAESVEDLSLLRHEAYAVSRSCMGCHRSKWLPQVPHVSSKPRPNTRQRAEQTRFAGPVPADHQYDLASMDAELIDPQDLPCAIGNGSLAHYNNARVLVAYALHFAGMTSTAQSPRQGEASLPCVTIKTAPELSRTPRMPSAT